MKYVRGFLLSIIVTQAHGSLMAGGPGEKGGCLHIGLPPLSAARKPSNASSFGTPLSLMVTGTPVAAQRRLPDRIAELEGARVALVLAVAQGKAAAAHALAQEKKRSELALRAARACCAETERMRSDMDAMRHAMSSLKADRDALEGRVMVLTGEVLALRCDMGDLTVAFEALRRRVILDTTRWYASPLGSAESSS